MNENEVIGLVIGALVVIVGLGSTICIPLIKVSNTIQRLICAVENLTAKFDAFEVNNHDDHKRIWQKNDAQDKEIAEHEMRIALLEKKG